MGQGVNFDPLYFIRLFTELKFRILNLQNPSLEIFIKKLKNKRFFLYVDIFNTNVLWNFLTKIVKKYEVTK